MGLEWNQQQLQIAWLLHKGLTTKDIAHEGLFGYGLAEKVRLAIGKGDGPPSLDPEYIKQAKVGPNGDEEDGKPVELPGTKKDPKGTKKPFPANITSEVSEASSLQLVPKVMQISLTPDIFIAFMCAVAKDYQGTLEQFISLACRDFWTGRAINPYQVVSGFAEHEVGFVGQEESNGHGEGQAMAEKSG